MNKITKKTFLSKEDIGILKICEKENLTVTLSSFKKNIKNRKAAIKIKDNIVCWVSHNELKYKKGFIYEGEEKNILFNLIEKIILKQPQYIFKGKKYLYDIDVIVALLIEKSNYIDLLKKEKDRILIQAMDEKEEKTSFFFYDKKISNNKIIEDLDKINLTNYEIINERFKNI